MAKFKRVTFEGARDADGVPLAFVPGVPARDLDGEAWYALPADLRENAIRLGLHKGEAAAADALEVVPPLAVVDEVKDKPSGKPAEGGK